MSTSPSLDGPRPLCGRTPCRPRPGRCSHPRERPTHRRAASRHAGPRLGSSQGARSCRLQTPPNDLVGSDRSRLATVAGSRNARPAPSKPRRPSASPPEPAAEARPSAHEQSRTSYAASVPPFRDRSQQERRPSALLLRVGRPNKRKPRPRGRRGDDAEAGCRWRRWRRPLILLPVVMASRVAGAIRWVSRIRDCCWRQAPSEPTGLGRSSRQSLWQSRWVGVEGRGGPVRGGSQPRNWE